MPSNVVVSAHGAKRVKAGSWQCESGTKKTSSWLTTAVFCYRDTVSTVHSTCDYVNNAE